MEVVHSRCAGMDVSKRDAKVCVRVAGRGRRKTVETVTTWALDHERDPGAAGASDRRAGHAWW